LGKQTSFFLGYKCPPAGVDTAFPCNGTGVGPNVPGMVVHQTALYDLILVVILLAGLLWLRRRLRFDGFLLEVFGAWYGAQRILEDFLREDKRYLGMTGSQWSSAVFIVLCLVGLFIVRRTPRFFQWDRSSSWRGIPSEEPEPPDEAEPTAVKAEE